MAVGFGIIAPTIPLFAKSFGVNNAQVGLIISSFAFARFASGLFAGKLVDKFGERIVYTTGIGFVAISSFAAAFVRPLRDVLINAALDLVARNTPAAGIRPERIVIAIRCSLDWQPRKQTGNL